MREVETFKTLSFSEEGEGVGFSAQSILGIQPHGLVRRRKRMWLGGGPRGEEGEGGEARRGGAG